MYTGVSLDLSAGVITQPGYTRVRASRVDRPDLIAPVPFLECVATQSIDRIRSVGLIQTIAMVDLAAVLLERNRVLRPHGLVFATAPHISYQLIPGIEGGESLLKEEFEALSHFAIQNASKWVGCVGLTERIARFLFVAAGFYVRALREVSGVLNIWSTKVIDQEIDDIRSVENFLDVLLRAHLVILGQRPNVEEEMHWMPRSLKDLGAKR